MKLDYEQRKAIGLDFIVDEMIADSPYGANKIKALKFHNEHGREALEAVFFNIGKILGYLKSNEEHLDIIRLLLKKLKNISGALKKCGFTYLHEVELYEIKNFLLIQLNLLDEFNKMNGEIHLKNLELIDMEAALDIVDPDKKRISSFSISETKPVLWPELWEIRQEKLRVESIIRNEKDKTRLEKLNIERAKIVAKEEQQETRIKIDMSNKLRPYIDVFEKNIDSIGELDLLIQKALLARKYNANAPVISTKAELSFVGMFNPMVENILAARGKDFTPLSIDLPAGATILTGANMGGKSVAIKTIVLNVCLARMGFYVFAESAEIPLFDGVYLVSEDLQSVSNGLSTFGAEIIKLNELINKSKSEFLLIALDEIARSTNPSEGAIIAKAVSSYLNGISSISILSTHYDNVAEEGMNHYQVAGLRDLDFTAIDATGTEALAELMDYSLVRVSENTKPPQDALNICKILSLEPEILDRIESLYHGKM